jgi:hypothetical protein
MSILNLNAPQGRAPRSGKTTKIWLGVGLLVAVLGIGSTLAANISLNGNQPTEFGQGVQSTAYCGGNSVTLTATPYASYNNTYATFSTTSFKISGIPVSCSGTDFNISFYDTSTASPRTMATGYIPLTAAITTATVAWFDTSTASLSYSSSSVSPVFPIAAGSGSNFLGGCDLNPTPTSTPGQNSKVTLTGALLSNNNAAPTNTTCRAAYVSNVISDAGSGLGGSFVINFNSNYTLLASTSLVKIVVTTQNETFSPTSSLKPCTYFSSSKWTCTSTYGLTASSTSS